MPIYVAPDGTEFETEKDLTPDQLAKVFAHNDAPPENNNSIAQDVLEGMGLDPIAHPDTIPQALLGMGKNFLNPVGAAIETTKGLYDEGSNRFGRYFENVGKSDSGYENALMAAQAAMAPVPFYGNVMENADKAISEGDEHAAGRLGGNVLATVSPFSKEIKADVAASKPAQFMMGGVDRFSPLASAAMKSPLGRGAAAAGLSYLTGSSPSTMLTHSLLAAGTGEFSGWMGKIQRSIRGTRAAALEAKNAAMSSEREIAHMAAEKANAKQIPMESVGPVPIKEDVVDRGMKWDREKKTNKIPPGKVASERFAEKMRMRRSQQPSQLENVGEMPPAVNNEKVKIDSPPPAVSEIPGSGESPSKVVALDPVAEIPTNTSKKAAGAQGPLDKDILRKYVSEQEAEQMLSNIEERKWLPETHEEWRKVNAFEEAGMERMEAMKLVRKLALEKAAVKNAPLNSRAEGTSPRQLGVDRRTRGVNPRALDNMRKEP